MNAIQLFSCKRLMAPSRGVTAWIPFPPAETAKGKLPPSKPLSKENVPEKVPGSLTGPSVCPTLPQGLGPAALRAAQALAYGPGPTSDAAVSVVLVYSDDDMVGLDERVCALRLFQLQPLCRMGCGH
jgi:hypothetical protein